MGRLRETRRARRVGAGTKEERAVLTSHPLPNPNYAGSVPQLDHSKSPFQSAWFSPRSTRRGRLTSFALPIQAQSCGLSPPLGPRSSSAIVHAFISALASRRVDLVYPSANHRRGLPNPNSTLSSPPSQQPRPAVTALAEVVRRISCCHRTLSIHEGWLVSNSLDRQSSCVIGVVSWICGKEEAGRSG